MAVEEPLQRYRFIELIAYWQGSFNTQHIRQAFSISRQQALKDIHRYQQKAPGNIRYDASRKHYVAEAPFHLHFISDNVNEYLDRFARQHGGVDALIFEQLCLPTRSVNAQLMRKLTQAIREQKRLDVDYISLSNPTSDGRIIVPHHFVNTGLRWHVRAFCEKSQAYRDFVLSRFRGDGELYGASEQGVAQDSAWNTQVRLLFKPDSRLSAEQQQVLVEDYQMHNGMLELTTRGCLVHYLVQQMQVNIKMHDANPAAQQLELVNRSDVKQWLFE